jgi:predicted membrane protein
MGKIGILCGGPDWPTSVLTGLLKCNLAEMMIGTLPMIFLIIPTVLTGAFFLKTDPVYSTIGSFLFICSLFVCAANGMYATYAVQNELEKHPNYLRIKLLKNRELDWIDYKSSELSRVHYEVNSWGAISSLVRIIMVTGLLIMNFAMFLFTFYGDECFGSYDLQTPSSDFKDGTITLVEPIGWVALGTFAIACICFYVYKGIMKRNAQVNVEQRKDELESKKEQWIKDCDAEIERMEDLMRKRQPDDYDKYMEEKKAYEMELADIQNPSYRNNQSDSGSFHGDDNA